MTAILRKVPIDPEPKTLHLADGTAIAIKSDQLIAWMSVTPSGLAKSPLGTPRFPVVLDTGFNHTFLMSERQLFEWGGIAARDLAWIDLLTADGQPIPLRDADVWIHPNRPGSRDPFPGTDPFRLELSDGIGVWPTAVPGSRRLPLLGTRALRHAKLHADINFSDGWFSLFTRRWLWFLR